MVPTSQALREKIRSLPHKSGIYIYKDARGVIMYVGKARDLFRRVKQYFSESDAVGEKTAILRSQIVDLETIVTESEFDALLLEAKLIRHYLPKYNVISRDDKSPLYIVLTVSEVLPRVLFVRQTWLSHCKKSDRVFGPFQSGVVAGRLMQELRRIIPYCTQRERTGRACFYTHIGLCNNCPSITANLSAGPERSYRVRLYRRQIFSIANIMSGKSFRYLGLLEQDMQRQARRQQFEQAAETKMKFERLRSLLAYHYDPTLYVQAEGAIEDLFAKETRALRTVLLPYLPTLTELRRIECIDISHLLGEQAVGSCVVLTDGRIDTNAYRRFRVKTVQGANDGAMIGEVLRRRLAHPEWSYPDLFIIDGGRGQLESARRALLEVNSAIPAIALAKRYEEIIIRKSDGWRILRIPHTSGAIHILQRIRNEAHRFAVSYHRKERQKFMFDPIANSLLL